MVIIGVFRYVNNEISKINKTKNKQRKQTKKKCLTLESDNLSLIPESKAEGENQLPKVIF